MPALGAIDDQPPRCGIRVRRLTTRQSFGFGRSATGEAKSDPPGPRTSICGAHSIKQDGNPAAVTTLREGHRGSTERIVIEVELLRATGSDKPQAEIVHSRADVDGTFHVDPGLRTARVGNLTSARQSAVDLGEPLAPIHINLDRTPGGRPGSDPRDERTTHERHTQDVFERTLGQIGHGPPDSAPRVRIVQESGDDSIHFGIGSFLFSSTLNARGKIPMSVCLGVEPTENYHGVVVRRP